MDNASVILEMLMRIQTLEKQVAELQQKIISQQNTTTNVLFKQLDDSFVSEKMGSYDNEQVRKRDTTKYLFNNEVYAKNRLVLAVVKDYVEHHKVSFAQLANIFHPSLQGSIGVVERVEIVQKRQGYNVRFFTSDRDVIALTDGNAYVCNQWGILNIPRFLCKVKDLGYKVQEIK